MSIDWVGKYGQNFNEGEKVFHNLLHVDKPHDLATVQCSMAPFEPSGRKLILSSIEQPWSPRGRNKKCKIHYQPLVIVQ